jgi:tRNA/rRNA methyltransferase
VILLAYEWSRGAELAQPTVKESESPAAMSELDGLIGQLEVALQDANYFYPPERTQATKATIRTILTKPLWSSREIQALRGIVRALSTFRSSKN